MFINCEKESHIFLELPHVKFRRKGKRKVASVLRASTMVLESINSVPDNLEGPIEDIFEVKDRKLGLRIEYQKCKIPLRLFVNFSNEGKTYPKLQRF